MKTNHILFLLVACAGLASGATIDNTTAAAPESVAEAADETTEMSAANEAYLKDAQVQQARQRMVKLAANPMAWQPLNAATLKAPDAIWWPINRIEHRFNDDSLAAVRNIARRLPYSLTQRLAVSVPKQVRAAREKEQDSSKADVTQQALLTTLGDSEKLKSLLSKVINAEFATSLVDIMTPVTKAGVHVLSTDLAEAVRIASEAALLGKTREQWQPELKRFAKQALQRDSLALIDQLRIALEPRVVELIVDRVSSAAGVNPLAKSLILQFAGDTIKKEITSELHTVVDVLISKFSDLWSPRAMAVF